ncbi:MAG: hypothetical protein NDF54_00955 [archaeon GB-1867-035]|nr:hypothetical protein [Candidatus Culexmicrobium profundum]
MVKIVHKPIKEIVISECVFYPSIDVLVENLKVLMKLGQTRLLMWAEGILFTHSSLPPTTDRVVDELLNGRIFWLSLSYTLMPEYKPIIKVNALEIPIINVTFNPILREVARWLKERSQSRV